MGEPSQKDTSDGVVEKGEIIETRSKVIRASGPTFVPSLIQQDEPTEKTRIPVKPKRSPVRYVLLGLGLVSFAAAAALMAISMTRPAPTSRPVETVAEMLGMTLDSAAQNAAVRAESIASSSMLRAGIETDAATLRDMAGGDLVFPVERGESLEVFKMIDGKPESMLRIPANVAPLAPPTKARTRLEVGGGGAVIIAAAPVRRQKGEIGGRIVLAVPVDLEVARRRVAGQALHVQLVGLAQPIDLYPAQPGAASGTRIAVAIKTGGEVETPPLSLAASIAVPPPDETPMYIGYACAGLSALMLALFGVVVVRGRSGAAAQK